MNKLCLLVVIVCGACSGKKGDPAPKPGPVAKTATGGDGSCPLPVTPDVRERFAVGVSPDHRVESAAGEAAKCHLELVANDVVKLDGTTPKLVAAGTFEGHCPGETTNMKLEAVAPAKVVIETNGLQTNTGELGLGKPITLDSKLGDKAASVVAHVADRCATPLSLGTTRNVTVWAADGCDKVAKLVPWALSGPADPKAEEMQIFPVGAGTCTIKATILGVTGDVAVTVK